MPSLDIVRDVQIERSPRVMQVEGMFDLPAEKVSKKSWRVELPIDDQPWSIGVIVGPSGAGKTTIAQEIFGDNVVTGFRWPKNKSIVDGFPREMEIKKVVQLLTMVGFSSPPSWLRPFSCLSTGEQFRVTIARALASKDDPIVIDEFTSVVDRTVAKISSAAISKLIRRQGRQLVAVSCHYDILEWLEPDWVYEAHTNSFTRRRLRRPKIELVIHRVGRDAWRIFRHHHYLNTNLSRAAKCLMATIDGKPVAFSAAIWFPHPNRSGWMGHRSVVLPDYQGVGIGTVVSNLLAAIFAALPGGYSSVASHPAMIAIRQRSPFWRAKRSGLLGKTGRTGLRSRLASESHHRRTVSFRYIGPPNYEAARGFGFLKDDKCPATQKSKSI